MATDYVTSPVTKTGRLLMGIGAGAITVMIRPGEEYPEGVSYAILLMNVATPSLTGTVPQFTVQHETTGSEVRFMRMWQVFKNGVLDENPTFKLVLGMCPTLAVTTAAANGVWMGLAVIFVLTMSNLVVSLIRDFIPDKIRIPCYVVVIASFVTIVDLLLKAYQPEMHAKLGIFIPLIVVNCIILARAEAFASKSCSTFHC